ncbi:MAG: DUF7088 domain-containing protein [Akkermansiaceae bacterium]
MSTPSTISATRPVRRIGRSFNVIIQVALFIIVIIAANYLSCARHERIDLTERRDFTLSKLTTQYLSSDSFQQRETPLHIIVIMKRNSSHYARIYNLLDEYKKTAGSQLKLEFVDPIRQTDRTLEIEKIYGIPYTQDMIITDGRIISEKPAAVDEVADEEKIKEQQLTSHLRFALIKNLYITDDQLNIVAWQDEDIITSAIIGAIEGKSRKIYLAIDKGDLKADQGQAAWQILKDMLKQQNITLTPIALAETTRIPEDAEGLAFIAPQYDLTESELAVLEEYWDRQSSSLFITLDPAAKLDRLRIFLRNYGITPRYDRITSIENGQTKSSVLTSFLRGAEINQYLGGKYTVFDGSSCSLEVRESDDTLVNRAIKPIALIQATDGWWGETRFDVENPSFNVEEDTSAPLYLAAAVICGDAASDETLHLVSRMVVISNTDFLATSKTRPEQADFVKSSINWLVGRDELIGIGPKKLFRHKITILAAHNSFISRIVLFFLPAAALLIALVVWNTRRA